MAHQTDHGLQLWRQAGLRATLQRLAILDLLANTTGHPGPEAVYRTLAPNYPGLSMNTAYQALHALEASGLLGRVAGQSEHLPV